MKEITVFVDFDFLATPQETGTLNYERVRDNNHFAFKYSTDRLKPNGASSLAETCRMSRRSILLAGT